VPVLTLLLIGLAVGLGLSYGIVVATLVVVIYGTVLSAILVLGWKPFEAHPDIAVGLRGQSATVTELVRQATGPQVPIDVAACVADASQKAQMTAPGRPPVSKSATFLSSAYTLGSVESYDTALERFNGELRGFEEELGQWLEAYEARRWPTYSLIRFPVAIHNRGDSVAEAITLNLRIPQGWWRPKDLESLSVPAPPKPPNFEQKGLYFGDPSSLLTDLYTPPRTLPRFPEQTDGITGPEYMHQGDQLIARFRIESLTHGDDIVSAEPLLLVPNEPGRYTITWTAHVGNLRRPASGDIIIEIEERPVPDGTALRTLDEVLATGDVKVKS
jgi:hypothetical protein